MGNLLTMGILGKAKKVLRDFTDKLYEDYKSNLSDRESFHTAILEIFNQINSAMLGVHYDPPSASQVKECYDKWMAESDPEKKKEVFREMIQKLVDSVKERKTNTVVMLAGVATPPASIIAKRVGENIPGISKIKIIPDFVLVPSATVIALVGVKFLQLNVTRKT